MTGGELRPAPLQQPLEPVRVEVLQVELELVAVAARDDRVSGAGPFTQRLSEAGDVNLQRLRGSCGRLLPPQLVDHPVGAQRLVGVQQQQRQDGAALAAAQRNALTPVEGLERAENAEVHASWACE